MVTGANEVLTASGERNVRNAPACGVIIFIKDRLKWIMRSKTNAISFSKDSKERLLDIVH